jgi:hypothetical protein
MLEPTRCCLVPFICIEHTTPQPQNSDALSVGIGRYSDALSVGIDLCRHLLAAAKSGVAIAYADRLSDVLGAIYSDT